ncbi:hypothetical protein NECHADRAFT_31630 [Paecilomyces variotii No. 5]|uniref:Zn(2)-C6 fungal-type domain-containing protein n=1 Tax=Byssochlamys spectabilis (strain No. 5 / NBRC 109023) TaxID=1356009 RepID=V5FZK8_BYSSN|nr:hypothetical protein NECHADRAFT_31630 [Paecilomyces variotii No. 5]
MPNIGKPSRGCQLCRQRRVKCDLERPACRRCIKYGVACPGYRDEQELIFRNVNPTNIKKRNTRPKQVTVRTSSSCDTSYPSTLQPNEAPIVVSTDTAGSHATGLPAAKPASLTSTIHEHWSVHSVPLVLNIYPALELLEKLYHNVSFQNNSPDSPLMWVTHLFSLTYIANLRYPTSSRRGSELETQRELGNYLTKTLRTVRHALQTREGVLRDDVLISVWMLMNYEMLIGSLQREQPWSPWHLHSRGLYSILKARGTAPLYTIRGRSTFWLAYIPVQINALALNSECPPESDEWLGVIRNVMDTDRSYIYHVSIFIARVCRVINQIMNILNNRDFSAASRGYHRLVAEFSAAEKDYDNFILANPVPATLTPPIQNFQLSGVIKGHRFVHLLLNFLTHDPAQRVPLNQLETQRNYSVRRIRDAAQSILDNVPVWIKTLAPQRGGQSPKLVSDALKIIWPLTTICIIKPTLPAQKREAAKILDFIGEEIGVRQAFDRAPAPKYIPEEAERSLILMELESNEKGEII